ncbi:MAG: LLM class flavin-dependent oxidoreductase, partial [Gammaproteobacteria bacterium]
MTGTSSQFGVAIPQVFLDGKADMALVRRTLHRAEELGYDSAWVQDQVASDVPLLESLSLLCYAAAVTERLKLGVSVIVVPIRNAPQLAKDIGTLDHLSGGRVILGVGLGPVFAGDNYFQIFGTRADEALRRFNESIRIMKSLWTETKTNIDGEFYTLHNTGMEPKPIQKPHPPLWFGGQHPNALRRAVQVADGYMGAGPTTTRDFGR